MNLLLDIDKINETYIFFNEPIENNILTNGEFIKIHYSNSEFNLTGLLIPIPLNNTALHKSYNKVFYTIPFNLNEPIIRKMHQLEEAILNKYKLVYHSKQLISLSIKNSLQSQNFKTYYTKQITNLCKNTLLLKISGIWSFNNEIGIIYKFLPYELSR